MIVDNFPLDMKRSISVILLNLDFQEYCLPFNVILNTFYTSLSAYAHTW